MELVVRVKKSLRRPIRKLSSCVLALKEKRLCAKHRKKRARGCNRPRRNPPPRTAHRREPAGIHSYQADLQKERKLREETNAQKNAERAALRAHFRRKYQLSESPKDKNDLRSVGGKVSLPHKLAKIIHPETKAKDNGFDLLSAFQGLNFGTAALTGRKHGKASTPTLATGNSCKVM